MEELTHQQLQGQAPGALMAVALLLAVLMLGVGIWDGRRGRDGRKVALVGGVLLLGVVVHAALLLGRSSAEDPAFRLGLTIAWVMNDLVAIAGVALSYAVGRALGRATGRRPSSHGAGQDRGPRT